MEATRRLGDLLDQPPPSAGVEEAQRLATELFGIQGVATPLGGERDRNFRVREGDGRQWVLKIVHPAEERVRSDFQTAALTHLRAWAPELPVPRLRMPCEGGGPDASWTPPQGAGPRELRVRMTTYLQGAPMSRSAPSRETRRGLGRLVGALDVALADLRHAGEAGGLLWDAHQVARVAPLLEELEARDTAARALEHVVRHAAPRWEGLRAQVIHNDANPHNVLTGDTGDTGGPEVTGIIDFGDLLRAPLVQDVATAAAYHVGEVGHPLSGPADVVAAFHEVCPLLPEEVAVLHDLMVARLVLVVAITGWRARRHPANRDYILRNSDRAWAGLRRLESVGCAAGTDYLRDALRG